MSVLFRVQTNTPRVYYNESRDFQVLGRLYDCVINGVKYDIDSMSYLTDSRKIRARVLQLLQTKLGFLTKKEYNDHDIRYVLRAFPVMLKNKGTILAVQQAVNVFLKLNKIKSAIKVWYVSEDSVVYGTEIDDHTIIVGLNSAFRNFDLLYEMLWYLLPTGFGFYFYYYSDIDVIETELLETKAHLIYVSDNINSQVRGQDIEDTYEDRLLGAVDTVYVASDDSIVPTTDGTYNVTLENKSLFIGIFKELNQITQTVHEGEYCIANSTPYYYSDGKWNEINFQGIRSELPTNGRHNYDIVGLSSRKVYYYRTEDGSWQALTFRGDYEETSRVVSPTTWDIVRIKSEHYYIYNNNSWQKVENKIENITSLNKVATPESGQIAIVDGVTYYLFNGNAWVDNTLAIYMLINSLVTDSSGE